MRHLLVKLAFSIQAIALCTLAPYASAQTYPNKPIRMVLGYPAGSGIDNVARLVAQRMERSLGQTVLIENKPGALSNIAAQHVARSVPDGYTLLFTPNSALAANVHLFKKLPFDPLKDFKAVGPVGTLGFALLVNPEALPVKSVAELTALIKKEPGKFAYGTGNATGQVVGALYTYLADIDVMNIPYKGVPAAVTDLIGARIDYVMADVSLAIPQVAGGRVKALAVTDKKRVPALKDVPTMIEAGFPDFDLTGWFGIFLPAGAPPAVVELLEKNVKEAVSDPVLVQALQSMGVEPWVGTSDDLAKVVVSDTEKWGRIIKRAGIVAE